MIESTFQIIPSVGAGKERKIWDSGVRTWDDFMAADSVCGISAASKTKFDPILEDASRMLECDDCRSLGNMLHKREHWRLYERFRRDAVFLDIETDGLERDSTVTVVTVCKGSDVTTLVNGQGLDAESLDDAMGDHSMIVTFNGLCFDVPVLRYSFPGLDLERPHFDLRFGCRKIGLTGGLKNIERSVGLARDDDIMDIDGMDAVRLWKQWTRARDQRSLDLLVEYNRADTVNLRTLADMTYERLVTDYAKFHR